MSLHQDKDEHDFGAPIVSVSLGLPATFLFGGLKRSDKPRRFRLEHGDVVVWGGPARLVFHGVAPLADGEHALMGRQRINLTSAKRAEAALLRALAAAGRTAQITLPFPAQPAVPASSREFPSSSLR